MKENNARNWATLQASQGSPPAAPSQDIQLQSKSRDEAGNRSPPPHSVDHTICPIKVSPMLQSGDPLTSIRQQRRHSPPAALGCSSQRSIEIFGRQGPELLKLPPSAWYSSAFSCIGRGDLVACVRFFFFLCRGTGAHRFDRSAQARS